MREGPSRSVIEALQTVDDAISPAFAGSASAFAFGLLAQLPAGPTRAAAGLPGLRRKGAPAVAGGFARQAQT